jgi:hypothetical protein
MAVIQISRIQIRRGQTHEQGLPQLASGEMGWSVDEQRLFIGNGSVAEGAPAVGNTEVLTESRMFEVLSSTRFTATNYTYAGHNTATTIITGPTGNDPIVRSLQQKLDDLVSVLDFGADNEIECSAALQRALDEIYSNSDTNKPRSRIPVRMPAGTYYVTATVFVPSYANIVGDGIDKTIIVCLNSSTNGTVFATTTDTSSIEYTGINISGMTIKHTATSTTTNLSPLMILGNVTNSKIKDVKFKGNYVSGYTVDDNYSAIELRTWVTDLGNIDIENVQVENLCYPITSDYDLKDIRISGEFKDLYQGITFATDLLGTQPKRFGPQRVYISNSKFDRIARQAIFAGVNTGTNNMIISENNTYLDVGGVATYDTAVITFDSHGNASINDNFKRYWEAQTTRTDVKQRAIIEGTAQVKLKFTDRRTLTTSTATQTLVRIPYASTITSVTIDYTLEKPDVARKGTINVVGSSAGVSYRDTYAVAGSSDGDLIFTAALVDTGNPSGSNYDTLAVQYNNPATAGTGTCIFNVSYYT